MIDLKKIRDTPIFVQKALAKRGLQVDFTELLALDQQRREKITWVEGLKAQRNEVNAQIPLKKQQGIDVQPQFLAMKQLSGEIKACDQLIEQLDQQIVHILLRLPNLPADDVVAGGKENNRVVRLHGVKPQFSFEARHHVELATELGLIDYPRGAKLSGNGFWLYRHQGALLEWALLNYFTESHLAQGFEMILPPHILNQHCGVVSGQFPKFSDDVFYLASENQEKQFLLPTAETALINLHQGEILLEGELPKRYFAYTPCFRKEAGSYRASERGMIRGHQFNKVELFQYTRPEDSETALQQMIVHSESLLQGLGIHYQVVALAAQDCSDAMGKTFDLEVWIPSMGEYKEVSSASNAYDYQARRGDIRFRRAGAKKTEYLHTLNASGLATSRLFPAILEQFQTPAGEVQVPKVLQKWLQTDTLRLPVVSS